MLGYLSRQLQLFLKAVAERTMPTALQVCAARRRIKNGLLHFNLSVRSPELAICTLDHFCGLYATENRSNSTAVCLRHGRLIKLTTRTPSKLNRTSPSRTISIEQCNLNPISACVSYEAVQEHFRAVTTSTKLTFVEMAWSLHLHNQGRYGDPESSRIFRIVTAVQGRILKPFGFMESVRLIFRIS